MRTKAGRLVGPLFLVLALLVVARRWLDVVEVRGRSMMPTLRPGDRLIVLRTNAAPRPGEIVLAPDPRDARRELVKRVARVDRSRVSLRGDNASESTDVRTFGSLPMTAPGWRVVARYWPPDRIGRPGLAGERRVVD